MGIGNSREQFGQRSSPPGSGRWKRNYRRGYYRRRRPSLTTTQSILPIVTRPLSNQPLYGSYYVNRPVPSYAPLQPIPSPYLPISYNNYSAPSNIPPQYMRMLPLPRVAAPYMSSPPMSMPYVQQPPIQPIYNNMGIPASMPGGAGYYPFSYPSAPMRLITDWTGGGKISPGFLGPPI